VSGGTPPVRPLLKDSRVKVNEPDIKGYTPLREAARNGHLDTIKWWVASGREVNLGTPGDIYRTDAIGGAKGRGRTEVVTLLERFLENPEETRHAIRLEIGWYDEAAAEMFALIVFVSDDLLQIKVTAPTIPEARFFSIATQLPLELQMVLGRFGKGDNPWDGKRKGLQNTFKEDVNVCQLNLQSATV